MSRERTAPYLFALAAILIAAAILRSVQYAPAVSERRPLAEFPLAVAGLAGETAFLTPDVLGALHVDDYLLRRYRNASSPSVWFYVAYYGAQPPDSRLHSPAVCLPSAGWYIARAETTPIRIGGRTIVVNRNLIQKGDDRQAVLYWYQMQGTVAAKELQAVGLLAWTSLTRHRSDEALVRINTEVTGTFDQTVAREVEFVRAAFPLLGRFLPE